VTERSPETFGLAQRSISLQVALQVKHTMRTPMSLKLSLKPRCFADTARVAFATLLVLTTVACGDQTQAPTPQANVPSPTQSAVPSPSPALSPNAPSKTPQSLSSNPSGSPALQPLQPSSPQAAEPKPQVKPQIAPPPQTEARQGEVPLRPTETASGAVKMGSIKYQSSETTPNAEIEQAIVESLDGDRTALQKTRYYYDRVDLNSDGKPEALVYLSGSYTCGTGGCMMLVLAPAGERYQMISKMTLVQAPVIVSAEKSAGWNDLVLEVSGGGATKHYARMQFDGSAYPVNPSTAPEVAPNATINGTAVMSGDLSAGGGIALQGEG
jgi:hypothetical protein